MNVWLPIFVLYIAGPLPVKRHRWWFRDIKAGGKKRKTRSLCKLTCAYHIRLSSSALLNTWLAVADRRFLRVVNISSMLSAAAFKTWFKLCCWHIVRRLMQYIVGCFAYHRKGEIHGSTVLKKQANKQQCMNRKLLLPSVNTAESMGNNILKKAANKQEEICRRKLFHCIATLQRVRNTRFMIASATSVELFLGIDIYYKIYLLLSVHIQSTSKEKRLTMVTKPGSDRGQPTR